MMNDSPMRPIFHFYCDESCHLPMQSDGLSADGTRQVMAIGGIWCAQDRVQSCVQTLRNLKEKHGLERTFEIKWKKVSPAKLALYYEYLDFFFDSNDLHFRAAVLPDKKAHVLALGGDHNHAYYNFYFDVLKVVLDPEATYNIFLDAKDTRGRYKLAELRQTLCNNNYYEVKPELIGRLQEIRSHEADLMQLADLFLGILTYAHRDLDENSEDKHSAKADLVRYLRQKSGYSLAKSTLPASRKFNLWVWHKSHRPHDKETIPHQENKAGLG